jgi:TetR/AcrR family transcriptional regulator
MDKKGTTQQKILNVSLTEFAQNGYETASTNTIALKAGVSKGTIFKYFPTKAHLFYAVFERELSSMVKVSDTVDLSEISDPLEKVADLLVWKVAYAKNHPEATRLLAEGIAKPPKPFDGRIRTELGALSKLSMMRLFEEIPMDRIRDGLTKVDVINTLQIAIAGLQEIYVANHPEFPFSETAKADCLRYLNIVYRGMEKNNG